MLPFQTNLSLNMATFCEIIPSLTYLILTIGVKYTLRVISMMCARRLLDRFHKHSHCNRLNSKACGLNILHARALDAKVRDSTPTRAEIWIEFSASCAPLIRLWDHNIGYQIQSQAWKLTEKVSKCRVDRMGGDT